MYKNSALLVVDIQNDFCPGGPLAIEDADKIIERVNATIEKFDVIVGTQDWHPVDHLSFASQHTGKIPSNIIDLGGVEQVLWPVHCVQGTPGAEFHSRLQTGKFRAIFRKGMNRWIDSYSAFRENDKRTETGLKGYLQDLDINRVFLCGLATDYCVFWSAQDAREIGLDTYVLLPACRGVNYPRDSVDQAMETMRKSGITLLEEV